MMRSRRKSAEGSCLPLSHPLSLSLPLSQSLSLPPPLSICLSLFHLSLISPSLSRPENARILEFDGEIAHNTAFTLQCDFGFSAAPPICPPSEQSAEHEACIEDSTDAAACKSAERLLCYDGRLNTSSEGEPCKPHLPCGCGTASCSIRNTPSRCFASILRRNG